MSKTPEELWSKELWTPSPFMRWYKPMDVSKPVLQQFYHDQSYPAATVEYESDDKCSIVLGMKHGEWRDVEVVVGGE